MILKEQKWPCLSAGEKLVLPVDWLTKRHLFLMAVQITKEGKIEVLKLWTEHGTTDWWKRTSLCGIKKSCSYSHQKMGITLNRELWGLSGKGNWEDSRETPPERIAKMVCFLKKRLQWWEISYKRETHPHFHLWCRRRQWHAHILHSLLQIQFGCNTFISMKESCCRLALNYWHPPSCQLSC